MLAELANCSVVLRCGFLVLLAVCPQAFATTPFPSASPESVGLDPSKLERLDAEMDAWQEAGNFVGAELLVIKRGRTILHRAYGWADREARRPATTNSIWSIKSMSKPVTATAMMMLVEEGKLSLDDKLTEFIPDYVGDPRTTLGHLVSHTTGYRQDDVGDPGPQHETLEDWVLEWAATEPNGTFGEFEYTDFGFAAAGYIVEQVSGVSIEQFTHERILDPLGLDDTSTAFSDDQAWRDRLNAWYRWETDTRYYHMRWRTDRQPWQIYPAAWGMFSTAVDYAEFVSLFLNGGEWQGVRLLGEDTIELMLQPHGFRDGEPSYGYGWFVFPGGDGKRPVTFAHSGGDGTVAYAYPDEDLVVVFMTHSREGAHGNFLRQKLAQLGIVDAPPRQGVVGAETVDGDLDKPLPAAARQFEGVYRGAFVDSPLEMIARVALEDDQLSIGFSPFGQRYSVRQGLSFVDGSTFRPGLKADGRWAWVSADETFRFFDDADDGPSVEMRFRDERIMLARRVDEDALNAEEARHRSKTPVDVLVASAILDDGVESAGELSGRLHDERPDDVAFHENMLIWLARAYMVDGNLAVSTAVMNMNVDAYPESPIVADRAGRVWQAAGDLAKARDHFAIAVKLATEQGHRDLAYMQSRLDAVTKDLEQADP